MSIEFNIDKDKMSEIISRLRNINPLHRAKIYVDVLKNITNLTERKLKFNLSGQILKVRTGNLRNSIGSRIIADNKGVTGLIGSGVRTGRRMKYANIHEDGGTITAKRSKFLTIPTQFAKTASGVPRFSARDLFSGKTNYKGGVVLNNMIFGINKTKRSQITPLFILKKSVRIPARKYLSKTVSQMQGKLLAVMRGTIERALKNEQA